MLFYRHQNTKEIERNSYYLDLNLLYEDFNEYKDEYGKDLDAILYEKYFKTLNMRANIRAIDLFNLVKSSDWIEVEALTEKYPLKYIFGMMKEDVDKDYSLDELLNGREALWNCEGSKYLALYEGELISNEGEVCGCIFNPEKIVNIYITKHN